MQSLTDNHQRNRIETLKQLYIGKCQQLNKVNPSLNYLKYHILEAELLVIQSAIPKKELPMCIIH